TFAVLCAADTAARGLELLSAVKTSAAQALKAVSRILGVGMAPPLGIWLKLKHAVDYPHAQTSPQIIRRIHHASDHQFSPFAHHRRLSGASAIHNRFVSRPRVEEPWPQPDHGPHLRYRGRSA